MCRFDESAIWQIFLETNMSGDRNPATSEALPLDPDSSWSTSATKCPHALTPLTWRLSDSSPGFPLNVVSTVD